jgi:hypothetical protein
MKCLLVILALLAAPNGMALEARDLRGLDVLVDSIDGPVLVDGVGMRIRRVTGAGVPQLAVRIEERWRREGSPVQQRAHAGWQLLMRLDGSRNEVIQWQAGPEGARLLHSILDLRRTVSAPKDAFRLPSGCRWGRRVEGEAGHDAWLQQTAICRMGADDLRRQLRRQLVEQGWTVHADTTAVLQVSNAAMQADVFVTPAPVAGRSIVIWLAVRSAAGATP